MNAPPPDSQDASTAAAALAAALDELPAPLFAVLDGGLFDDLPGDLTRRSIACRSLFLDHADKEVERAGPWLVRLADERIRAHVVDLAVAKPCAAFWCWAGGDMALWRHLRTINEVLIPAQGAPENGGAARGTERVLFRHWDPNVLASVLALLDPAQFARVLGHGRAIVLNAPDHGGVRRAPRPADLPSAPRGPLRLTAEQMDDLQDSMRHASRQRIRRYLLDVAPREIGVLGERRLDEIILESERTGRTLGLVSERARGRWAYIMVRTNGRALEQPGLREWITDGAGPPDAKVRVFLQAMARAERDEGQR
ncbi:DUF4123 domain-containing protein [Inquilinus limosus]|uniref:DUF4123 domain-containing protein n=1 Tax=Inquilinus limosus TaxID=171674 RepID=UPI00041AF1C7|nr:DUF4123 domain-containing protein [Inquilinus limosus]